MKTTLSSLFVMLASALIASGCRSDPGLSGMQLDCDAVVANAAANRKVQLACAYKNEAMPLRLQIENGDLAASERCILDCGLLAPDMTRRRKERWATPRLAAENVIAAYGGKPELEPRQQLMLMAAHHVLANANIQRGVAKRRKQLDEVMRLGLSEEPWSYLAEHKDDREIFPLADSEQHFHRVALSTVIEYIGWKNPKLARTGNVEKFCDTSEFEVFMTKAGVDKTEVCVHFETSQEVWQASLQSYSEIEFGGDMWRKHGHHGSHESHRSEKSSRQHFDGSGGKHGGGSKHDGGSKHGGGSWHGFKK